MQEGNLTKGFKKEMALEVDLDNGYFSIGGVLGMNGDS